MKEGLLCGGSLALKFPPQGDLLGPEFVIVLEAFKTWF